MGLHTVNHACNTNYLGDRDRRITVQASPGKKLVRPYLNKQARDGSTSQVCGR
jgi:hypothetical protein